MGKERLAEPAAGIEMSQKRERVLGFKGPRVPVRSLNP